MSNSAPVLVLNVDDEEAQRYVKSRDLRLSGFEVIEATTGAEALRLIEERHPPVVLLDVHLPDISGYDVCSHIKDKWPEVMVLQTSATFTTSLHRTRGLDSGADSYLVQPAEPFELAAAINALLRIRNSEDSLRALNASLEQRIQDRVSELAAANERLKEEIAQREKAEAALVQAQKMEAVGQLTGGLAHDFNNLLTAVVGNLDLIRARVTDPRLIRFVEQALKAAQRGSKLTAQLLAFSRTQKLATVPVDVNALIEGMRELLTQTLGSNVAVRTELAADLPAALADANQLELAILNLSINARDAMPEGGSLTIGTAIGGAIGERRIEVTVADTGTGMPAEVAARAFDPFFTTKPAGKGTGLGLSQVYGIVRQLGGDVLIESTVGAGTSVRLSLPVSPAGVESASVPPSTPAPGRAEKLLVVDDDADVRSIVTGVLSELGYVVDEAADTEVAMQKLASFEARLLIVDYAMPAANGAELAKAARHIRSDLRILFISGYADSAALEKAVGNARLLRKPFRPAELAAAVRAALA
jgi:signal transduction histidine kinase